jgi:hypothetical protein
LLPSLSVRTPLPHLRRLLPGARLVGLLVVCLIGSSPVFAQSAGGGGAAAPAPAQAQAQGDADREIAALLARLEGVWSRGDPTAYVPLLAATADRAASEQLAAQEFRRDVTRVVIRERDRAPLPSQDGAGFGLIVEILIETGSRGNVGTWRLDIVRPESAGAAWGIKALNRLTGVQGLYRLALTTRRQFRITNLKVTAEDLTLTIPSGVAFTADADNGTTALVLLGHGEMAFQPKPLSEKVQIRLFSGGDELHAEFNTLFLRLNPGDAEARLSPGGLQEEPVRPQDAERAQEVFTEEVSKSFGLDLSDLSRETWSLVPPFGDFLAEIRTGKYGTLTYARAANDAEDISLFDRRKRKNISAYGSSSRLATRGQFYSDSDQADYSVVHYDINTTFDPVREWIEGRTVLRLRVRSHIMGALTLRLADTLTVRSVSSPRFGRLLSLRVKGQNSVLVNLPDPLERDEELIVAVAYSGRVPTANADREVLTLARAAQDGPQDPEQRFEVLVPPEPRVLYTNRSYWYPQSPVNEYSTANLRLTVPEGFGIVATGALASGSPVRLQRAGEAAQLLSVFTAPQPARYFAAVVTKLPMKITDTVRPAPVLPTPDGSGSSSGPSPSAPAAPTAPTGHPLERTLPLTPQTAPGQTTLSPTLQTQVLAMTSPVGGRPGNGGGSLEPSASEPVMPRLEDLQLTVTANPRQTGRIRSFAEQTSSILSTYAGILDDIPYPTFTLALVDDPLPGGHSPAYFALLHQPLPTGNYSWRNDPVAFDRYPQFFLAHELAHQFWGDAVGGENYHEQWISEGFAQYFAVLYAERSRSKDAFEDVLRQLRRTAAAYDRYGPVWLGYRLGHLQNDSRIFRALVYNKGALVLHMLRRMLGDEAFFRGMRRFYRDSRFKKVGTDDVRRAFESESGRDLARFFEKWILESGIPRVAFSYTVVKADTAAPILNVRFEQKGEIYDFPVTVRVRYPDGRTEDLIVPITERLVERALPLKDMPRDVEVNDDDAALIDVVRS